MITLNDLGLWFSIISPLGVIIYYAAIKPLNVTINSLREQMVAVALELKESREARRMNDIAIAELKKDMQHTNDRVDAVELEVSRWIDLEK